MLMDWEYDLLLWVEYRAEKLVGDLTFENDNGVDVISLRFLKSLALKTDEITGDLSYS